MSEEKMEQLAIKADRTKSIEAVRATKSGQPAERLRPTTPIARWKRLHFKSSIILMSLGAIAVIVYLLRSGLGQQYEGLGAALCAIACGGFLVWHAIHLFAEQDALEEQQLHVNQATVSSPQPNPAGQEMNLTTPPPESGQNFK